MSIKKLYLDNFRGFFNNEVSIGQVNFLVGENSSGKTSILKLLTLLSSQEFWLRGLFRNTDIDFNYFGDIHTKINNKDGVSLLGLEVVDELQKIETRILFELSPDENHNTRISALKFYKYGEEFHARINDKSDEIRYSSLRKSPSRVNSFSSWCRVGVEIEGLVLIENEQDVYVPSYDSPYFFIDRVAKKTTQFDKDKKQRELNIIPFDLFMGSGYRWIAPIRMKPQKTYDENIYDYSSDGSHVPYILKSIINSSRTKKSNKIIKALRSFGKESNLFDDVSVNDFGSEGNSPFSIELTLSNQGRQITNVGYGVSQVLPIVIEILNEEGKQFAIQQPEVHLHPKAQASFGEFIYNAASNNTDFLIETHSDFIVDRYRQKLSQAPLNKTSQVLFFDRRKDKNIVTAIPILKNGQYSLKQPKKFREFFYNEALKNLSI